MSGCSLGVISPTPAMPCHAVHTHVETLDAGLHSRRLHLLWQLFLSESWLLIKDVIDLPFASWARLIFFCVEFFNPELTVENPKWIWLSTVPQCLFEICVVHAFEMMYSLPSWRIVKAS